MFRTYVLSRPMSFRSGLERLGPMEGKSEADFVTALGQPALAYQIGNRRRLMHWRSGLRGSQRIAVVFDEHHQFVEVFSREDC